MLSGYGDDRDTDQLGLRGQLGKKERGFFGCTLLYHLVNQNVYRSFFEARKVCEQLISIFGPMFVSGRVDVQRFDLVAWGRRSRHRCQLRTVILFSCSLYTYLCIVRV